MKDIDILKKKIIYRSEHRGTKEMDILMSKLSNFLLNKLSYLELEEYLKILDISDVILYEFFYNQQNLISGYDPKILNKIKQFFIQELQNV